MGMRERRLGMMALRGWVFTHLAAAVVPARRGPASPNGVRTILSPMRSFHETVEVRRRVGQRAVALRAPHRLREALERLVQRVMAVVAFESQSLKNLSDTGRLVDRELLLEREVQAHVQE